MENEKRNGKQNKKRWLATRTTFHRMVQQLEVAHDEKKGGYENVTPFEVAFSSWRTWHLTHSKKAPTETEFRLYLIKIGVECSEAEYIDVKRLFLAMAMGVTKLDWERGVVLRRFALPKGPVFLVRCQL